MKIMAAHVTLASAHVREEHSLRRERLEIWGHSGAAGQALGSSMRNAPMSAARAQRSDDANVEISSQARALQPRSVIVKAEDATQMTVAQELEYSLLKLLVERLTGQKLRLFSPESRVDNCTDSVLQSTRPEPSLSQARKPQAWGLRYDYYESYQESESTSFQAQAVVMTEDGRQIDIDIDLRMSRQFESHESINIRAGDALLKDPLVLNFSGAAVQLTQTKFRFDIDADGREDQISFLAGDAGFLALDKNTDGRINDGSELFGALSGDGFADLSLYDSDGNQWIDENDDIFGQLRIWTKNEEGQDQLLALGERGVGAIYLGHVTSEFSIKDEANELLGQVRETGLFLDETGAAGTVQQLDLRV